MDTYGLPRNMIRVSGSVVGSAVAFALAAVPLAAQGRLLGALQLLFNVGRPLFTGVLRNIAGRRCGRPAVPR